MSSPPKKKRRYPVSSFGPEVMAALIKGSQEKVILKFTNADGKSAMTKAIYLQHRIHTLRAMMREENHEHAELVTRARTSRMWGAKVGEAHAPDHKGEKYVELHIYPNDSQFASIFAEAGVELPEIKIEPSEEGKTALEEFTLPDPYKDFKA